MNDLLGHPIIEKTLPLARSIPKKRKEPEPKGYGGTPGKGPKGETCKTCRHYVRKLMSKAYLKCALRCRDWTGGPATDIKAGSPACENWASKPQREHERVIYAKS